MKFVTDENIYKVNVQYLRKLGHDVLDIKEREQFGISDLKLLNLAQKEERILLTLDKDFADVRFLPKSSPGIIVIRVKPLTGGEINRALKMLLRQITLKEIRNTLLILEEDRFRTRKLS